MLLRKINQLGGERGGLADRTENLFLGIQPEIHGNLIVPAPAGMDLFAEVAKFRGQCPLHGEMHILVRESDFESALLGLSDDFPQLGDDLFTVRRRNHRRLDGHPGKHDHVRRRAEAVGLHKRQVKLDILTRGEIQNFAIDLSHGRLAFFHDPIPSKNMSVSVLKPAASGMPPASTSCSDTFCLHQNIMSFPYEPSTHRRWWGGLFGRYRRRRLFRRNFFLQISVQSGIRAGHFAAIQKFPRELAVGCRTGAVLVVLDDRLAEAGRLAQPDTARDQRFVDFVAEVRDHFLHDLLGQVCPHVVHRHHDAFDLQGRIGAAVVKLLDESRDDAQSFERVVLALERDEDRLRGDQRVHGQDAE